MLCAQEPVAARKGFQLARISNKVMESGEIDAKHTTVFMAVRNATYRGKNERLGVEFSFSYSLQLVGHHSKYYLGIAFEKRKNRFILAPCSMECSDLEAVVTSSLLTPSAAAIGQGENTPIAIALLRWIGLYQLIIFYYPRVGP
jgi:hypothetical protein